MIALSNRVHIFARPHTMEKLTEFFTSVLGCQASVISDASGMPTSILLVRFPNNVSMTVDFTDAALDEQQARRGAYLELKADDPPALTKKIREAGLSEVTYAGSPYFYFQAPGGQVFRIVPASES